MKKVLFPILALVLALGLALPMAGTVAADVIDVDSSNTTAEINTAIAVATSGDVIQFAHGTYNLDAPVVVAVAEVTLQGDTTTPSNVVINAPTTAGLYDRDCFQVKANDVTIQGFKMVGAMDDRLDDHPNWLKAGRQNAGIMVGNDGYGTAPGTLMDDLTAYRGISGCTFSHNEFVDCSKGIYLYHAKDCTVSYSTFTTTEGQTLDNFYDSLGWNGDGIHVYLEVASDYPTGNTISHNTMDNVRVGVFLNGDSIGGTDPSTWDFHGTTIEDNNMTNVWNAGIILQCASGTAGGGTPITIRDNDINTSTGRRSGDEGNERGLVSVHGDYAVIAGNTLTNSEEHGMWIDGSHHTITGNTVTFNTKDGIHVGWYKETEPNNTWTLPEITREDISISNNTLQDNTIQVGDPTEALDIDSVFNNNTFDRAVVVDRPTTSLLHTIWSNIQDAIDAAQAGDTILVAAGTYAEAITIGKANLTLQSESKWGAIIRPTSTPVGWPEAVVYITADGVTVDGFEIDGTIVCDNGILGWETSGLTIKNNKIHGAVREWDGCGILLFSWGNSGTVYNNLIENNEVYDTGRMGIMVMDYGGGNYTVTSDNIITGNTVYDVWKEATAWDDHGGGIQINVGKNCSITNNEVYNVQDNQRGIYMYGSAAGNNITSNTLRDNPTGIQLWISGEGGSPPIDWGSETATSPQVHYNNIYSNSSFGAISTNIQGTPMVMDATYNWWGHASGPSGLDGRTSNKGKVIGKGDAVSANVDWDPWLPQPVWHTPHHPVPPGWDSIK